MADWNGLDFRRSLDSAERLSDLAMPVAFFFSNTFCSRSSASERSVTSADQRLFSVGAWHDPLLYALLIVHNSNRARRFHGRSPSAAPRGGGVTPPVRALSPPDTPPWQARLSADGG